MTTRGVINVELRAIALRLAARPDGLLISEFMAETGQVRTAANAYLYRMARAGLLVKRLGNCQGVACCRYWADPEVAAAFEFDASTYLPKPPPPPRKRGTVMAAVLVAVAAGAFEHGAIAAAVGNPSRESIVKTCDRLVTLGKLWRADDLDGRNHKAYRYFASQAERDEWAAANDFASRQKAVRDGLRERRLKIAAEYYERVKAARPPKPAKEEVKELPKPRVNRSNEIAAALVKKRPQTPKPPKPTPSVGPDFSKAKRTVCAPMPDRWAVEIPRQGGCFSSMRPGSYVYEPASCAARAASKALEPA